MLAQKEYYEIVIKDNDLGVVGKVDYDTYNYFKNIFKYVYHTESGETYPLNKDLERGVDMLIVDGEEHLHELLDDLRQQGFCDSVDFNFIWDYFSGEYELYNKAF